MNVAEKWKPVCGDRDTEGHRGTQSALALRAVGRKDRGGVGRHLPF